MNDSYMFQNRFSSYGNKFGQNPFGMSTSAQYKQFHEMKSQMTMDVLQLFKANQIRFLKAPVKAKCRPLDPVSTMGINLMEMFQVPNLEIMQEEKPQTKAQRRERLAQEKKQAHQSILKMEIKQWNPFEEKSINTDPEKTLLVARLNYETSEKTLKFQFQVSFFQNSPEVYIVRDQQGKSRGYGFVEFDSKQDFVSAYKRANHRKIDGRKIIVDYQKGRTTLKWRPRRFGGGQGTTRMSRQQYQLYLEQERQKASKKQQKKASNRSRSRSQKKSKKKHEDKQGRKRSRQKKDKKEKRDHRRD